jgi:hypothetical protein
MQRSIGSFARWLIGLAAAGGAATALGQTPVGTAFTYQGRLEDGGAPANGVYDLRFQLSDAPTLGLLLGTVEVNDVQVTDGTFTVTLDFGSPVFAGDKRWLAVGVRPGTSTGGYTSLSPRQELSPAPYAIYATKPWERSGTNLYYNGGSVGIGTVSPLSNLHVVGSHRVAGGPLLVDGPFAGTGNAQSIYCQTGGDALNCWNDGAGDGGVFRARNGDAVRGEILNTAGGSPGYAIHGINNDTGGAIRGEAGGNSSSAIGVTGVGYWGIYATSTSATGYGAVITSSGAGGRALQVSGISEFLSPAEFRGGSDASLGGGGYVTIGPVTGANIVIDNNEIMARNNGAVSTLYLNNDGGSVRVPVLEITGADVAERFPCSEPTEPGTVMELDPANPGQLRISKGAYNKRVAGVVSGAGGLPAGAILGNLPGQEDNPPIAMSGRVWVKCETSAGAIEVGDLLTTSDTPGHAMKVTNFDGAHGCVIGKAMSTLKAGETGLVLVLVNLQ